MINQLDGGVSRRLVRRCRSAASILLVVGAAMLLIVAVARWNAISALLTLAAGVLTLGALLLLKRGSLWSAVGGSGLPDALPVASEGTRAGEHFGVTGKSSSTGTASSTALPVDTVTIGPPRPMSPGLAGAPMKRRLGSAVVPMYASGGPPPGGGALIVHARADGTVLVEGDSVYVWRAAGGGLETLVAATENGRSESAIGGRFALYRESDGAVFLGTTRLTDTW